MRVLFGLLYLAEVHKASKLNLDKLWSTDGTGVDIFRLTRSKQRFVIKLRCLQFDNIENIAERKKLDKLAAVRGIFYKFVSNCQVYYTPSEYLTIDEKFRVFSGPM